jgi:transcriptional repressor NrdR
MPPGLDRNILGMTLLSATTSSRICLVRCPFCADTDTHVLDSRLTEPQDAVRRRRRCRACDRRFTTYERYDQGPLYLRKRDGSRQPFDRGKLLAGLERAAIKRPVERDQLEGLVDRIVAELRAQGGTPAAERVGELALRGLKEVDRVAYVRFASVYRRFEDIEEFEAELARLEAEPPLQREHLFELRERESPRAGSVRSRGQAMELPPDALQSSRVGAGRGVGSTRNSDETEER